MPLASGTRLGSYEILSIVGAGGMGEVYRANDTRLDRIVAIKILNDSLARSAELRQRFDREMRAISHLDHPNICALYDVGEQTGTAYLVMQYLDGHTLEERLVKGPLALREALQVAIQVASGLAHAHRAGVVHRDLKPGNIMLTREGAKLLDFGLAKISPAAAGGALSSAPTTPPETVTAEGTILGTFQYMAPEQLEGDHADTRSDVFAFGAVVYEMITGRKAFAGKSQASVIAAIMSANPPPMADAQPLASSTLEHIVRRCLAKHPDERWQSMSDVLGELEWLRETSGASNSGVPLPTTRGRIDQRERLAWIAAATVLMAIGVLLAARLYTTPARPAGTVQKFAVLGPADGTIDANYLALSPDGHFIAFIAASSDGRSRLWIRPIDEFSSRPLAGTEDARYPFWSPDSRFIGFFAERKLKKIQAGGGPAQTVCDAPYGLGGTWNRDGVIVFAPDSRSVLYRVSDGGGVPTAVTSFDASRKESAHVSPVFLPDEKHFLYHAGGAIFVGALDSTPGKYLTDADSVARYAPPAAGSGPAGYLLYIRDHTLLAQAFDAARLQIAGAANPVTDSEIQPAQVGAAAPFAVDDRGMLAYRSISSMMQLTWFDRSGDQVAPLGGPERYDAVEIARDGKRVAVERFESQGRRSNVWLVGPGGEAPTALTFNGAEHPRWSSDGQFLAYQSGGAVVRTRSDGSGKEEVVYRSPAGSEIGALSDWSPDGRLLALRLLRPGTTSGASDLVAVPMGSADASPIWRTQGFNARFSPDGRWVAYTGQESGLAEVYVQPFPPTGAKWLISHGGGIRPRWRGDGRELFFVASSAINGAGRIMAASIDTQSGFHAGTPVPLVNSPVTPRDANDYPYAVSPDGQRILVVIRADDPVHTPITVVSNWAAGLKN